MDYQKTTSYLKSFINYEKSSFYSYPREMRLERMKALVDFLKLPYENLRYIHIAGSKGKGSICAIVTSILVRAGYKVGLFTSPHLQSIRERIRVFTSLDISKNLPGMVGLIPEYDFCRLVEKIRPKLDTFCKKSKYGKVTFFEVYTVLAITYFLEQQVDFAVLEVGLGGKLDATNIINSCVCGISPLSLEHTDKLGNNLKDIAAQKAGIIKSNSVAVTSLQPKEALEVIRDRAKKKKVKLYEVGRDILYEHVKSYIDKEIVNLKTLYNEYSNLDIPLLGSHQVINVATAVGIIEALSEYQIYVEPSIVKESLEKVSWPGRFELIHNNPRILLDGALNRASAETLRNSIISRYNYKRLFLILGMCRDKDIYGVCQILSPLADEIFLTKVKNPRSALPQNIAKRGRLNSGRVHFVDEAKFALKQVLEKANSDDFILLAGSLFLVGELRSQLAQNINLFTQV